MKALGTLLIASFLALPAAAAIRPITPRAPEFPEGNLWINAEPLTLKLLKNRRVVLLAFINTASLNSLRTLGFLREWHKRYALHGLMLIGVLTPEYRFQNDPLALRRAIERQELEFPIVIDRDRKIWDAYENPAWPALHLVNHKGRIIFDRIGEGAYSRFEREIQAALEDVPRQKPADVKGTVAPLPETGCGVSTYETYTGSLRGKPIDRTGTRDTVKSLLKRDGEVSFKGPWTQSAESMTLKADNPIRKHDLSIIYSGASAFGLFQSPKPLRFYILQNDRWLHFGNAGRDIDFDESGKSFVEVSDARVYHLVTNEFTNPLKLSVKPEKTGGQIYGFSFSDWCLKDIYPGKE